MVSAIDLSKTYLGPNETNPIIQNSAIRQILENLGHKPNDIIDVRDYRAVGDGVTDDTAAIQAAINAAATNGGGIIYFPPLVFAHTGRLLISSSGIRLLGIGSPQFDQGTRSTPRTEFKALATPPGGQQLLIQYPDANNTADTLWGVGVSGICFNANGFALRGLELQGVSDSHFENLLFIGQSDIALMVNCTTNGPSTQHNIFRTLQFALTFVTGTCLQLDGETNGNASYNLFQNLSVNHNNGHGIVLKACDNNDFHNVRIFQVPAGTGKSVIFSGNNSAAGTGFGAANNTFFHVGAPSVLAQGTASGLNSHSIPIRNSIYSWDDSNNVFNVSNDADASVAYRNPLGNVPCFNANKNNSSQTGVVAGADTVVTFGNATRNTGGVSNAGYYSTSTSRFTPPQGDIALSANVTYLSSTVTAGRYRAYLRRNGTDIIAYSALTAASSGDTITISLNAIETGNILSAGTTSANYYEVIAHPETGANKDISGDPVSTFFTGRMLW